MSGGQRGELPSANSKDRPSSPAWGRSHRRSRSRRRSQSPRARAPEGSGGSRHRNTSHSPGRGRGRARSRSPPARRPAVTHSVTDSLRGRLAVHLPPPCYEAVKRILPKVCERRMQFMCSRGIDYVLVVGTKHARVNFRKVQEYVEQRFPGQCNWSHFLMLVTGIRHGQQLGPYLCLMCVSSPPVVCFVPSDPLTRSLAVVTTTSR